MGKQIQSKPIFLHRCPNSHRPAPSFPAGEFGNLHRVWEGAAAPIQAGAQSTPWTEPTCLLLFQSYGSHMQPSFPYFLLSLHPKGSHLGTNGTHWGAGFWRCTCLASSYWCRRAGVERKNGQPSTENVSICKAFHLVSLLTNIAAL